MIAEGLAGGTLATVTIDGASDLLHWLSGAGVRTGIATANVVGAARLRLDHAGLWHHVASLAHGAGRRRPQARHPQAGA